MAWTLYEGDNLDIMPTLPDKHLNLIGIDPPYNKGKDKWDKIPDYIGFMGKVFKECERLLKDNGSFYFFHDDFILITELQRWLQENTAFIFKQLITWLKIDPAFKNYGFAQQRLSQDMMRNYYDGFTEYCLFYTFQDETGLSKVMLDVNNFPTLRRYFKEFQEALGLTKKQLVDTIGQRADHCFRWGSTQWDMPTPETYAELCRLRLKKLFKVREYESIRQEYEELRSRYEGLREGYESQRYTFNTCNVKSNFYGNSNVWKYPPAKGNGHSTPKPVPLIENIILHSSNPGDLILDCFAGEGTTGEAAERTGRNSILIEKEPKYCSIIRNRLSNLQIQQALI